MHVGARNELASSCLPTCMLIKHLLPVWSTTRHDCSLTCMYTHLCRLSPLFLIVFQSFSACFLALLKPNAIIFRQLPCFASKVCNKSLSKKLRKVVFWILQLKKISENVQVLTQNVYSLEVVAIWTADTEFTYKFDGWQRVNQEEWCLILQLGTPSAFADHCMLKTNNCSFAKQGKSFVLLFHVERKELNVQAVAKIQLA